MHQPLRSRIAVDALIAAAIAIAVMAVLLTTSRDLAMVFDEAFTVDREMTLAKWFAAVADPPPGTSRSDWFRPAVLEDFWRFSRREPDGHPPFYALIGVAGWWVVRGWVDPLTSYRFGPMALTAATCGLTYLFLARRQGRIAGATAATALVLAPRVFAHAHYAHYDMPVTCLWLLAQMAFVLALRSAGWAVAFGGLLGLAAGTKFTGWFAVAPALGWWALCECRPKARRVLRHIRFDVRPRPDLPAPPPSAGLPATRALALGLPVAALTLYAIQPPWWSAPLWGLRRFLVSNLTREQTVPVTSLYLGTVYRFALPWHNTLVLTAVTMPVLVVALGIIGIAATAARSRSDRPGLIWPMSWAVLMIVRALPSAPGHDVERLLLPSLASLCVLAGIGAGWLSDRLRSGSRRLAWAGPAIAALVLGECLLGIAQVYPYNLSYYNLTVGGLPGAERLGLEATYYWDTLGPEFLAWVRRETRRRSVELCFPLGLLNIMILRDWGLFPPEARVAQLDATTQFDYVLQRNPGIYAPWDWWLERHGHPIFTIRRQEVELLRVYPAAEYAKARDATSGQPGVLRSSQRPGQAWP
jgi:4-amino-4-deoxy-L-arabinose transferase-like glycosyltransferase